MKKRCAGFSLLETLIGFSVLALLAMAAFQLLDGFAVTTSRAAVGVETRRDLHGLLARLRADLEAAAPRGDVAGLTVSTTADETVISVLRPRERVEELGRMGFTGHVIYRWSRADGRVRRTEYHAADDPGRPGSAGNRADGSDHEANAHRLVEITPAERDGAAWVGSPELRAREEATHEVAVIAGVREMRVACFEAGRGISGEGHGGWDDPARLPGAVRIDFLLTADGAAAAEMPAGARAVTAWVTPRGGGVGR